MRKVDIRAKLVRIITCALSVTGEKVRDDFTLRRLGADSMTLLELTLDIETRFGIEFPPDSKITLDTTVEELATAVEKRCILAEAKAESSKADTSAQLDSHKPMSAQLYVPYHRGALAQHAEVGKALSSFADEEILSVVYGVRHEAGVARCHAHITYVERGSKCQR